MTDLITVLTRTWKEIEQVYNKGNICSERHLQSEIFKILSSEIDLSEYQIFVEPSIYSKSSSDILGIIPDILITREDKIVCVFELKYTPTGYSKFQKDISTFGKFNQHKGTDFIIYLEANPINGDLNYEKCFTIDFNILFAYGIIANEEAYVFTNTNDIWRNGEPTISSITNYLQLNGKINNEVIAKFDFISNLVGNH